MRVRRVLIVVSIVAVAACGITAVGELAEPERPADGGVDASLPDARLDEGGPAGDGGSDAFDADFGDVQGKCLEVCDGGCDAGWCTLDCTGTNACQGGPVVCPPGVFCEVKCNGATSCTQGVDCTKSLRCAVSCGGAGACTNTPVACSGVSCSVDCAGAGACTHAIGCDAGTCDLRCVGGASCQNGPVTCTGSSCTVACGGAGACAKSVQCDAGVCNIGCTGNGSCVNNPVECAASTCTIQCGADAGGGAGKDSCNQGVTCIATTSCEVGCISDDVCINKVVSANAPRVDVRCIDNNACSAGVFVTGGDAGIVCRKNGSCGARIDCDAGKCAAECLSSENPGADLCCAPGSTCILDASACNATDFTIGCP